MITRMSELFLRTLREDPADAEVPSHKLLVRAGYVRRAAPGIYSWLPLGLRTLRKLEDIVRVEMDKIGAQELLFPALLPREPYEATNRWSEYGEELFRLKDRKGADMLLGPTHEEMFTQTVKDLYSSYKDFPVTLYQIQTKYRDEARPRAGILRGREFVMKDSYSFDMSDEGLEESYAKHRAAYQVIFDSLNIDYVICQATSGAMGGSASEEFLAISETGEDTFVVSSDGQYAANVEAVDTPRAADIDFSAAPEPEVHATPNADTMDALVEWAHGAGLTVDGREVALTDTLKCMTIMYTPQPTEENPEPTEDLAGVLVPGDRDLDEKRLEAALAPATYRIAEDEDFAKYPFLAKGYISPVVLNANDKVVFADPSIAVGSAWIAGADKHGHHVAGVVNGRDFSVDKYVNAATLRDGDPAPEGHGTLTLSRGIELGHIFQLGRKYTEAMDVQILDENGKRAVPTMGSYGIGVSRMMAVLVEQNHDEKGLIWPKDVAPYQVHVAVANKDEAALDAGDQLVAALDAAGVEVLFDDRPKVSPGVKFKDAELLGMPFAVILGRAFKEGNVELRIRGGETLEVPYEDIVDRVLELVRDA